MGWFRFYDRMIDSPQVLELNDTEFRLLVSMWCLASAAETRGVLPFSPRALQRRVLPDRSGEDIAQMLAHLTDLALIAPLSNGAGYTIMHWEEHQYEYASWTPEARREQKRKERQHHHDDEASVSQVGRNDVASGRKTDTDTDPEDPESHDRNSKTPDAAASHAHTSTRERQPKPSAQSAQGGDHDNALIHETETTLARWRTLTKKRRASLPSPDALHSVLQRHYQRGMTVEVLHCEILKLEDEATTAARPLTLTRLDNWLNQWHAPPPDAHARIGNGRHVSPAHPEPPTRISASQANQWWITPTAASAPLPATHATRAAAAAPAAQVSPDTAADDGCVANVLRSPPQASGPTPGQIMPPLQVIAAR